ncbi:glycerol kinase GlpK [Nocardioides acrostichi]|uniref:glycerol kinase n=1 Tax=Nocardioides acrostichi TaxID=2784339 RepID=A0A930UYL2_9ACTN|nr:glycerol kinase GlpK [Nocardioides acrostichi]MBF4160784.1 glycerol kinase GlpK [Nocardioides acrostichi]
MSVGPHSRRLVASIDQGTGSTRCLLFDAAGRLVSLAQREHAHRYPRPGWSEHDASEIWSNVRRVVPQALSDAGATPDDVVALGIANQRESCVVWERRTGRPLSPVITWEDTRASGVIEQIVAAGHTEAVLAATGIPPASYFAAGRLRWLLDTVPDLERRALRGEVAFGTMETWLIWNLTGGEHLTDVTNASRTNLMNLDSLRWDSDMLDVFDIPEETLPEIRATADAYGTCAEVLPGVPITAALGDQQAALFGQTCFDVGQSKCTFGTGAFFLMNVGQTPVPSRHGLLATVGYALPGEPPVFALEGSIAVAGSLVQWVRDNVGLVDTAPRIETLARTVSDNGGCYVVPAFSGLYAPRWDAQARGVIVGLTAYVTSGHLARSVLEATAWQTAEVVEAVEQVSGQRPASLRVDGGMTTNHLLMQNVADVLDLPVERPLFSETVSVGAAYAAGLSAGVWPDLDALRRLWRRAASWQPEMDSATRDRERAHWAHAVDRARGWLDHDPAPGRDEQARGLTG